MKLLGNMLDLDNKLSLAVNSPVPGHTQMELRQSDSQFFVVSPDGTVLGEMNLQLEEALNSIFDQQYTLEFEVYAPIRAIRETISKATKEKDAIARVQINVYGTRAASGAVGRELSSRKIYLQQPECIRSDTVYDNPHFLKLGEHEAAEDIKSSAVVESLPEENTRQVVKETISGVYSALTRGQHLQALEGDRRLSTSLLSYVSFFLLASDRWDTLRATIC
jgi:SWI/SNF-related matrix-associated actin-dependent regulator of chromatin subfamily A3